MPAEATLESPLPSVEVSPVQATPEPPAAHVPPPAPDLNTPAGADEPSGDIPDFHAPDPVTPASNEAGTSTEDAIAAKWQKMMDAEKAAKEGKTQPQQQPEQPKATEAPKVEAPKAAETTPADPEDAALKSEIDAVAKNLPKEQREAFAKKTYENRDLKRQLKAAAEANEKALAEATAKLKALESAPKTDPAEIEGYKKKISDYETHLAVHNLKKTDLYRTQVAEPLAGLESKALLLAKGYDGLSAEEVTSALKMPLGTARSKEISRLAGEMSDYDKTEFFSTAREFAAIALKEADLQANAKVNLDNLTAKEQEAQAQKAAADKAAWDEALPKSWEKVVSSVPILSPIEGNAEWNDRLTKAREFASTAKFDDFNTESKAEILHRAGTHPLIVGWAKSLEAELKRVQSENARLRGATPTAGGSSTPPTIQAPPTKPNTSMSLEDALEERINKIGYRFNQYSAQ